jgi:hypothetical protein
MTAIRWQSLFIFIFFFLVYLLVVFFFCSLVYLLVWFFLEAQEGFKSNLDHFFPPTVFFFLYWNSSSDKLKSPELSLFSSTTFVRELW